jgi:hypothetical protein
MSVDRVRRVESNNQLENVVDDYVTLGYRVESRGQNSVKLKEKKSWGNLSGHVIIALLTVWWTIGIGNLIYAIVKHVGGEEIVVKLDKNANQ